jgi:ribonuclease Y
MDNLSIVLAAVGGLAVGLIAARVLFRGKDEAALDALRRDSDAAIEAARAEAEAAAKADAESARDAIAGEVEQRRKALDTQVERLRRREDEVDQRDKQLSRRENQLSKREKDLGRRENKISRQEESLEASVKDAQARVEAAAQLSREEAYAIVLDEVREEAERQGIEQVRAVEDEAKALAEERARMIVSAAIQRYASEHVAERTVTTVALANDDMKGRIIGREGRNIRAFEAATGCDLVVDDTPGAVVVSGFNPVRREIARLALIKLLADGRIHPARIEEVVERTRKEMGPQIKKYGEDAALELEISNLRPELVKALGRLHFVTGFGHNVLRHSVEVGFLAGAMAAELGLDPRPARRAGLLHDIGKSLDQQVEGTSASVGAELARKQGESKAVIFAIAHQADPNARSVLAQLVGAANALSEERPGARREALASHVKRLESMEDMISDMEGVSTCHVIQAGREVRVVVDNARMNDRDADLLARKIASQIARDFADGNEIRVTVIRSTRAVQYAR